MKGGGSAIALLIGKHLSKKADEDDAPESSKGDDSAREFFDEMVSAINDEDNDAAFEAFQGAVRACKGHEE